MDFGTRSTVLRRVAMNKVLIALAGLAVVTAGAPVRAHHSFAAQFDDKAPVTLKGTLSKMEWLNPHTWIHVDVKDADGKVVTWAIEGATPNNLIRRGLRQVDFPAGVELVVFGYRAKNGTPVASGEKLTFADGRNFYLGASDPPKVGP
jgi:uncharacterized protein DUF6152